MTLTDTTVSDNSSGSGGGIYNIGRMTLTRSKVLKNSASTASGGGIYNQPASDGTPLTGIMMLTDSTVADNTAGVGGGIANHGQITLTNTTVSGNRSTANSDGGGGIINFTNSKMNITNSTIKGNYAYRAGGGIYNY